MRGVDFDVVPMDVADQSDERIETERRESIRRALAAMLPDEPQVVVAGEDGAPTIICYDCLDPISPDRLQAYPRAVRCIDCQIEHERLESRNARIHG
ncbi:MAG TPA: TraR/DksA C4-type zinc finger protein [Methylococcus sp.]|nr:TraR/DksA C4-type zinc finger protein [Methylococcus sp.]